MIKAVFDTNVFVSALFWEGASHKAFQEVLEKRVKCFSSKILLLELEKVLKRDFEYSESEVTKFIQAILLAVEVIQPQTAPEVIKTDPSDNRVLECAVDANADDIVTQDKKHLLILKEFSGIKIVSPEEFLKLVRIQTE